MEYNKNSQWTVESIVSHDGDLVLMGLDLSPRHCGIAISDTKRIVTTAIGSIYWNIKRLKILLYKIVDLIKEHKVKGIVLGLPVNVYNILPKEKNFIKTIGHNLGKITGLPFFFQEEHLSTVMSTSFLRGHMSGKKIRTRQNHMSAAYILQCFLDENR